MTKVVTKYQILELNKADGIHTHTLTIYNNLKDLKKALLKKMSGEYCLDVEMITNYKKDGLNPSRQVIFYDAINTEYALYNLRYPNHPITKRVARLQTKLEKFMIKHWND